jgi:GNAT superfamily N-acetyltransferase
MCEPDVPRFAARVRPVLAGRPVEHNVLLTLLAEAETAPDSVSGSPRRQCLWVEDDDRAVVGVAWYSPPWPLLVSRMPRQAIEALVDQLATTTLTLAAVNGLEPEPESFAELWRQRTGRAVGRRNAQRLYQLGELRPPVGIRGAVRVAQARDLEQLGTWMAGFSVETRSPAVESRAHVARLIEQRQLFVWDDQGGALSMAALRGPVAGVVRVSAVYTPPPHRRRGYASALVAAITRRALDQDAQACVLYTDADNPTSNAIYQAIGYRPRYEAAIYTFQEQEVAT